MGLHGGGATRGRLRKMRRVSGRRIIQPPSECARRGAETCAANCDATNVPHAPMVRPKVDACSTAAWCSAQIGTLLHGRP